MRVESATSFSVFYFVLFVPCSSGHYDNFDQGIAFFLPNMTWLQPPGYVHQMLVEKEWKGGGDRTDSSWFYRINQTFQPLGLAATLNDTTAATVSAQV